MGNHNELVLLEIEKLKVNTRFSESIKYMQHGNTSIYEHSIKVAYLSCKIARKLDIKVDYNSLIRGALLHDYFLYDWHDSTAHEGWHGFRHPMKALKNAKKELELNEVEEDIILKHMFPLTIIPPRYRESWIVTMADKISALIETVIVLKKKFAFN